MPSILKWLGAGSVAYAAYASWTYLRYGHVPAARGDQQDPLLDSFMPVPDVRDRHAIAIAAPPDLVLAAAKEIELDDSRITRAIFKARQLIFRSQPTPLLAQGLYAAMQTIGWGVLAETERELVFGAVTKPWEANPVFRAIPPPAFAAFAEPDHVKIVWTLRVDPAPDGGTIFRTETRAMATDEGARARFRRYWALLSPGIIAIRMALMPAVRAAAEARWPLIGDELVPEIRTQLTHAVTIAAPPRQIWPWLVQMGGQRAGWYSWDRLDNGGRPSADRIVPELQHLDVGDVLPYRPSGGEGFIVLRVEPEKALVLGSSSKTFHGTWAFVLEPIGDHATRLITRYRAGPLPSLAWTVALPAIAAVHGFMERKQLRTIKERAEHVT